MAMTNVVEISRGAIVIIGKPVKGVTKMGVIVQADIFGTLPSVLVCPITDVEIDAPLLRIRLDPSDTLPLAKSMWIMAELLTAIPRSMIGTVIGHIAPDQQRQLDRALIVVTGIA
jgi:mRNA interferase MazF